MKKRIRIETREQTYSLITGITYGHAPAWYGTTMRQLQMDMIVPKQRLLCEPRPVIVWICGGAFRLMNRAVWMPTLMHYVKEGFSVAAVDYRVSGEAAYPANVQDVKAAIRYLRAHSAELGIDPGRIAVMGESAGGYLAAMAGLAKGAMFEQGDWLEQSSEVQAVVNYYGKVDLEMAGDDPGCDADLRMLMPGASKEHLKAASPVNMVKENAPPFIIFHGENDPLVPIAESEHLYEELTKHGIRADFYIVENEGHGTDAFYQREIQETITAFLKEALA